MHNIGYELLTVTGLSGWFSKQPENFALDRDPEVSKPRRSTFLIQCLLIFFLALGVRVLTWQDNRLEVWRVQTFVTSDYKDSARQLLSGDLRAFVSDLNHMEHPPGYPILLAGIFKVFGDSNTAIEFVQLICDSVAAVILFMIAAELLPVAAAMIAGMLAALSPQFAYYSVLLLPDSLAIVPVLLAVYLLVRARRHPNLLNFVAAGALVGVSCWLRANALLLAPFLAAITPLITARGKRVRASAALIFGTLLVVAPITIKNAIVFHHFIPLSLGAGQTLLEGIAEYDETGRFNIPKTDLGIMRQEAEWYGRPEYALMLFTPDGIQRERWRIARGLGVIRANPAWFGGVMLRRGISSMRLDRVPVVARESPVSHVDMDMDYMKTDWLKSPSELIAGNVASGEASVNLLDSGQKLQLTGDNTKYGNQIVTEAISVQPGKDYAFRLPLKLEEGRVLIKITDRDQSRILASVGIDVVEGVSPEEQPLNRISLPFVSSNNHAVRLIIANNASAPVRPMAQLGRVELFDLGPSSYQWLRYLRIPIGLLQKFLLTAWILPLVIIGIVLLVRARQVRTVALLLVVPVYYMLVQSALHTERRYVLIIQYFFLVLASVALWWVVGLLKSSRLRRRH
jgi:hypothetical protein